MPAQKSSTRKSLPVRASVLLATPVDGLTNCSPRTVAPGATVVVVVAGGAVVVVSHWGLVVVVSPATVVVVSHGAVVVVV
jgi:hypothetical protein